MANFCVTWSKFTMHKKHDINRDAPYHQDAPYLWVFGIIVDANTLCFPGTM